MIRKGGAAVSAIPIHHIGWRVAAAGPAGDRGYDCSIGLRYPAFEFLQDKGEEPIRVPLTGLGKVHDL